jgi:predicted acylesterase/phospholipase RssA
MLIPPLRISLAGGGARAPGHVGALLALEERGLLRHVKEYLGTSCGALIAMCICIGYTLEEIKTISLKLDMSIVQDLEPEAILEMMSTYAIDTSQNLEKFLRAMLVIKGFPDTVTFADLSGTGGLQLRVFAVDLNRCLPREFSAACTPTFSVLKAVQASMTVPLYFKPIVDPDTGHLLVDGGVYNHSPFWCISDAEKKETLALNFSEDHIEVETIPTFGAYVGQIYYSTFNHVPLEIREQWKDQTIWIHCGTFPAADFGVDEAKKMELMNTGYADVLAALDGRERLRQRPAPRRRFSAP